MLKLTEQSSETTNQLHNTTGQHAAKKHQHHHRQTLCNDPLKSSNEYLAKAEVKPDGKNFLATDHLATKPILWRVAYNARSRKINICMKGTLHIVNLLLVYEHYVCVTPSQVHIKGFFDSMHNTTICKTKASTF